MANYVCARQIHLNKAMFPLYADILGLFLDTTISLLYLVFTIFLVLCLRQYEHMLRKPIDER